MVQFALTTYAFLQGAAATLKSALADKAKPTKILTYHVVPGRLSPSRLAGAYTTVDGGTVTVTGSGSGSGSGQAFKVDDADVVCGDVQTANATVCIVDSVLMPPTS